jgi:ABC-type nickel/cobalt efflux system permease component RcnA
MLLLIAVAAVGVFHTLVPDHWLPITLLARQEGWTRPEVARVASGAGLGHALSTLAIGLVVWIAGAALAGNFTSTVDTAAGLALIGFGLWIALGALRDLRAGGHSHGHPHGHPHRHQGNSTHRHDHSDGHSHSHPHGHAHATVHGHDEEGRQEHAGHRHRHRHPDGRVHTHYHRHDSASAHPVDGTAALVVAAPLHEHDHPEAPRRALLLILGSSPMVEGIPAFLAASRFGVGLLAAMAVVFTLSTVLTYTVLCVVSLATVERVHLGPLEPYGEVVSGAFIALVGLVFLVWVRW